MENPLCILIIEDNENDAALIIRHIKKVEPNITYDVIETSIQMEAALEQHHWDFIICDYSLPQFNAINALKLFRAKLIDIPFIVISGSVGEETAVELMKAGAHDCIMKNNLARLVPVFHRELAEAEIRRNNKRVEARNIIQGKLLDLIGQSVIVIDESGTITYWNNASKALYGWSPDEVMGRKLHEIMTHPNLLSSSNDITKSIKNGESWSRETEGLNKEGLSIPVHITYTPIFDENGDFKGVIGISYDISERRKSENAFLHKMDELAASNEELQRINRLTIGREIRMIELKRQCNNFAAKLGMNQPYPLTFINEADQQKKK